MQLTQPTTQSTKSGPSIGLFLLYIFASVALVIFIGYPKFSDYRTKNAALSSDTQNLSIVQADASRVTTAINSVKPTDVTKIASAIPKTPNVPDLYAQIESLANASTVHIVSIQGIVDAASATQGSAAGAVDTGDGDSSSSTDSTTTGPIKVATVPANLGTVSLAIDVSGNYNAVQAFLNSLYTSLRIISVQQTIMTVGKSGATTGGSTATSANAPAVVDLKAQMQTYYTK